MGLRVALILTLLAVAGAVAPVTAAQAASDAEDPGPPTPAVVAPETAHGTSAWPDHVRRSAIYSIVGFGTPVGFVGLEGVHRFGSWFELAGGIGSGLTAAGTDRAPFPGALQWEVMPRLRLGDDHHALTFGVGLSGGNYGNIPLGFDCESDCNTNSYPVRYVVWGNAEVGVELWKRGFAFRAFGGYARGCTTDGCTGRADGAPLGIPYMGLGFGYAF